MEINANSGRPPVDTGEASQAAKPSTAQQAADNAKSNAGQSSADTLSLTNRATQLQRLEAQIAELPVVDVQRVEDVQQSLATGSFEVHPAQVADKLLSFEAGLSDQG